MSYFEEPQNLTSFTKMFEYSNSVSNDWLGKGILIAVYVSILIYLFNNSRDQADRTSFFSAMMAAGFVTMIIGIFFRLLEYVNDPVMYLCVFSFVAPVFLRYVTKS